METVGLYDIVSCVKRIARLLVLVCLLACAVTAVLCEYTPGIDSGLEEALPRTRWSRGMGQVVVFKSFSPSAFIAEQKRKAF